MQYFDPGASIAFCLCVCYMWSPASCLQYILCLIMATCIIVEHRGKNVYDFTTGKQNLGQRFLLPTSCFTDDLTPYAAQKHRPCFQPKQPSTCLQIVTLPFPCNVMLLMHTELRLIIALVGNSQILNTDFWRCQPFLLIVLCISACC